MKRTKHEITDIINKHLVYQKIKAYKAMITKKTKMIGFLNQMGIVNHLLKTFEEDIILCQIEIIKLKNKIN